LLKESIIAEAKKVRNLYNNSPEKAKWKIEVLKIIDRLEGRFSLQDIYNYTTSLELLFPENKHIKEKIRQQLQFIRDDGIIIFIGNGKYKKT